MSEVTESNEMGDKNSNAKGVSPHLADANAFNGVTVRQGSLWGRVRGILSVVSRISWVVMLVVTMCFGLFVGMLVGTAHKSIERQLAFKEGFESGKSCKTGALGVPLGARCEVDGWLERPRRHSRKIDDAENVFYLDVSSVNGKGCRARLKTLVNKDDAERFKQAHRFVGYETINAEGVPDWLNDGRVSATDYFVEHYFVITDVKSQ